MVYAYRTSAGLYYFAAKMASERHSALASWVTGWANITGQVSLVCSIDYTWFVNPSDDYLYYTPDVQSISAQMITTAITVASDGAVVLGAGPTFGILLAILVAHGAVCSAATSVMARVNVPYVIINGEYALS